MPLTITQTLLDQPLYKHPILATILKIYKQKTLLHPTKYYKKKQGSYPVTNLEPQFTIPIIYNMNKKKKSIKDLYRIYYVNLDNAKKMLQDVIFTLDLTKNWFLQEFLKTGKNQKNYFLGINTTSFFSFIKELIPHKKRISRNRWHKKVLLITHTHKRYQFFSNMFSYFQGPIFLNKFFLFKKQLPSKQGITSFHSKTKQGNLFLTLQFGIQLHKNEKIVKYSLFYTYQSYSRSIIYFLGRQRHRHRHRIYKTGPLKQNKTTKNTCALRSKQSFQYIYSMVLQL
eukprot:TRINITY_DN749_c0_g1_i4.p1 TRINITY_DN749_c0_g1~~TRINITY_DN749_c0_g1_i4.p1  ORF type:complete len:284 (-),score=-23.13 TRINITY_DN749_c0_g1_i4:854-1705(-)